jgi:hypothetical protein
MTTPDSERRPIIDPVLLALKSRRVVVALAALLVGVLCLAVPEVQPVRDELLTLIVALALAVIGGYSLEDAARAGRERASLPPDEMKQLIKEVLNGIVDETNVPPDNTRR